YDHIVEEVADISDGERRDRYTWTLPTAFCGEPVTSGTWSRWSSDDRCPDDRECFEACPQATVMGAVLTLRIDDDKVEDNRGRCSVRVGCVTEARRTVIEACRSM
ncbi:MAG: hypothetical protein AAFV29_02260, partial [Myxococcota bacterium]